MAEESRSSEAPPRALALDPADNVAVAVVALGAGESVAVGGRDVTLRQELGFGHKFAVRALARGDRVVKYDEVIGLASADIGEGEHVHVHNVESARLPGPEGGQ